ncbi:MlrC C-terminus-domain-containing protein [Daldinia caldariorum]|uniref:MlrC C-terminus-domain-containing protein n=1 Tax=Daldinia caldariorum TaxID=326644 RepID=UPI002008237E|nr:MlrC C-terminus-domain-containing protein [Daldinia caldariorum]KAI1467497.1 MlrC C-terminus-domain-containing protein [Daldinia caldariorum]
MARLPVVAIAALQRQAVAEVKLDGFWFDVHGAMCVEGLDDVEYEALKRCREPRVFHLEEGGETKDLEAFRELLLNLNTLFQALITRPCHIDTALASDKRPYFISGGLTQLLARPEVKSESDPKVIYASVPGSHAVQKADEAGIATTVTVTAGAEVDDLHAGLITMTGRVHSIKHGDSHAEIEVVQQLGSIFTILTKLRTPYHHENDFTESDLGPRSAGIVIAKIGYLEPELYDMAEDWMLGLTPGGVDQDLERLGHKRI